jgi:hypothetical protein
MRICGSRTVESRLARGAVTIARAGSSSSSQRAMSISWTAELAISPSDVV